VSENHANTFGADSRESCEDDLDPVVKDRNVRSKSGAPKRQSESVLECSSQDPSDEPDHDVVPVLTLPPGDSSEHVQRMCFLGVGITLLLHRVDPGEVQYSCRLGGCGAHSHFRSLPGPGRVCG
jgi:hypothetical protein